MNPKSDDTFKLEVGSQLAPIAGSVLDAVIALDGNGEILIWNELATQTFGWTAEEALGRNMGELIVPPELRAAHHGGMQLYQLTGRARVVNRRIEISAIDKSGRTFPVELAIVEMKVSGRALFVGFLRDISARQEAEERLARSEARLELATRASDVGIWDWRLDTDEVVFSSRAKAIWGFPENGPVTTAMMGAGIHADDVPATQARFSRATDPAIRDRSAYQYRVRRPDGSIRWVRAHAEAVFEDRAGLQVAVRYVGTMADVTDELQREAALRRSEGRLKLAIEAGRMAVWSLDAQGAVQTTPEFNRLMGLPQDANPTLSELQTRYYPGELERLREIGQGTMARGERHMEFEYRHLWPDDSVRWLLVRAELLFDGGGQFTGAIGVAMDITDRRESEERLRLLAREVDHRANNLLAVVQGAITLTDAPDVPQFREALLGRVSALAHAHQLLASSRWLGADLRRLVEEELRPFAGSGSDRVRIEGAREDLGPEAAQAIAMVIHELTTNAVKYGALSVQEGQVEVSWELSANGDKVITWRESGGPPVRKPHKTGMGARVIARALTGSAGGRTEIEWRPEGVCCRIYLPAQD